jgi:hypothetical protein
VGRGPSLLRLTPADFPPGPVITINLAAHAIRELHLPNDLYLMQKDGCVPHTAKERVPLGCRCPNPARMVTPTLPETVILSKAESPLCFRDYPKRMVVDVRHDFGLPWYTMSAVVAVRIAYWMGADTINMLGFDSRNGDSRRVEGTTLVPGDRGYPLAVVQVEQWASTVDVALTWHGTV